MFSNVTVITIFLICVSTIEVVRSINIFVKTTDGIVIGKERKTSNLEIPYISFLGIPYGEPPIEDLRFSAPKPFKPYFIKFAIAEGNTCMQLLEGNEDCLNLNINVPQINDNKDELLPVIVFIHGGFFIGGNSRYDSQSPDYFLEENIIFVSINYRLDVFGFLTTEDEAAYGNWGIKDQILALEWIRENIKYFGGDKHNITLMGQSAGSTSVNYLLQTPKAKDLFQKAIMQSGSMLNIWALNREPKNKAFLLGNLLGIYTNDSRKLIEELRKINAKKLIVVSSILYAVSELVSNPINGLFISPSVEPEHEGAIITGRNYENLEAGNFNQIPVLMGFNSQEGYTINQFLDFLRPYLITYDLFEERFVSDDMNANNSVKEAAAKEIKKRCFGNVSILSSTLQLSQFITEDQFVRPITKAAELMAKFTRLYLYRFSYTGEGKIDNGTGTGVIHGGELRYLFYHDSANQTSSDILTRQRLISMWTNFAKTSYPSLEACINNENLTWPGYSDNGTYLNIGEDLTLETNLDNYRINWWNYLFDKYGTRPFISY